MKQMNLICDIESELRLKKMDHNIDCISGVRNYRDKVNFINKVNDTTCVKSGIWWLLLNRLGKPNSEYFSPLVEVEKLFKSPMTKEAIKTNRCIILASMFAIKTEKGSFLLEPEAEIGFAGVYRKFKVGSDMVYGFALITSKSVAQEKQISSRLPLMLNMSEFSLVNKWLNADSSGKLELKKVIKNLKAGSLRIYPVKSIRDLSMVSVPFYIAA